MPLNFNSANTISRADRHNLPTRVQTSPLSGAIAGKVIPLEATSGQIHWSVIDTDNQSMIGRSEKVDPENGISTTFLCFVCCPDGFHNAWMTPGDPWAIPMGTNQIFGGFREDRDCFGRSPFGLRSGLRDGPRLVVSDTVFVWSTSARCWSMPRTVTTTGPRN